MAKKASTPTEAEAPVATATATVTDDIVAALVKEAKGGNSLTFDQMVAKLPDEVSGDPDAVDQIIQDLETKGIEVGSEIAGTDSDDPLGLNEVERADNDSPDDSAQTSIYERAGAVGEDEFGDKIDDPVRMYLSQMGEIPLLTRDEEIDLARRIEIYRDGFTRKVMTMPDAIKRGIQWVEEQKEIKELQEKNAKSHGSSPSRDDYLDRAESHLRSLYALV
ncbi:MAG: sigma-70 factor domain-containing protein, partial [Planctomycetota bacterium]